VQKSLERSTTDSEASYVITAEVEFSCPAEDLLAHLIDRVIFSLTPALSKNSISSRFRCLRRDSRFSVHS
jgi:hypothetical protein